jgi:hypothetical protein
MVGYSPLTRCAAGTWSRLYSGAGVQVLRTGLQYKVDVLPHSRQSGFTTSSIVLKGDREHSLTFSYTHVAHTAGPGFHTRASHNSTSTPVSHTSIQYQQPPWRTATPARARARTRQASLATSLATLSPSSSTPASSTKVRRQIPVTGRALWPDSHIHSHKIYVLTCLVFSQESFSLWTDT